MIVLHTPRVYLRHWVRDDWKRFAVLAQDPRVVRYIGDGRPWTNQRVKDFVEGGIKQQGTRGWVLWPVIHSAEAELIGICGFNGAFEPDVEIGWWLSPNHWGQGLATEMATAVMDYGFRILGFSRLISVALPDNRASIRVMEKLGMTFDRQFSNKGLEVVAYAKPNPLPRHDVPHNLYSGAPAELPNEWSESLLENKHVRIERIISEGHASPTDFWYDQETEEWILLLSGAARLRLEGHELIELRPGSYLTIAPHQRHQVEWTDPQQRTTWLAIHHL